MNQWNISVQQMIEWIEQNIEEEPTLLKIAREVGYSPYYCSTLFHKICGLTMKSYLAGRRLCYVAMVEDLAWNYNPRESSRWWIPGGIRV